MRIVIMLSGVAVLVWGLLSLFVPQNTMVERASIVTDPNVRIGADFVLTDHRGQAFDSTQLRGKPMLVFFGFTHCPQVCPVTAGTLSQVLESFGQNAAKIGVVFVSVDPQRDTPEVMAQFLTAFHPEITGVTGTEKQIKDVITAYKAYAAKAAKPQDSTAPMDHFGHEEAYLVDHSSYVYLMNKEGGFEKIFPYNAAPKDIASALRPLL